MGTPDRECFIETVAEYLLDVISTEDLQLLLTEEETWKHFVAEVDLSREEEAALQESLAEIFADPDGEDEDELQNDLQDKNERKEEDSLSEDLGESLADTDVEDEDGDVEDEDGDAEDEDSDTEDEDRDIEDENSNREDEDSDTEDEDNDIEDEDSNTEGEDSDTEDEEEIQNDLWHKERFLDAYPRVKLELEEIIRKLHALADKVDKVHRDCTISKAVASSSSAVSGVLTILGLALAPVTAGVSLALSATGLGLGVAAAVTSVSTSIVEKVSVVSAEDEASKLVPTNKDTMKGLNEVLGQSGPRLLSLSTNTIQRLQGIQKCINAIPLAKANTRLANNAKRLMTTGKISARNTKQVQKAFGGTALAMTKGVRIMGAATAGFFLLQDVISLVEDSKHLHEGAKSECAAELRHQAQDLEQKLRKLKEVHDSLTK